jgi:ribosomal protein S10
MRFSRRNTFVGTEMTFVTKLRFQSGDREALDETVTDLKEMLTRKGVKCKGPHTHPSDHVKVPLYADLAPGAQLGTWGYELYEQELEIHGSDEIAGEVGHMDFHDSVHVEIEIAQKRPAGH